MPGGVERRVQDPTARIDANSSRDFRPADVREIFPVPGEPKPRFSRDVKRFFFAGHGRDPAERVGIAHHFPLLAAVFRPENLPTENDPDAGRVARRDENPRGHAGFSVRQTASLDRERLPRAGLVQAAFQDVSGVPALAGGHVNRAVFREARVVSAAPRLGFLAVVRPRFHKVVGLPALSRVHRHEHGAPLMVRVEPERHGAEARVAAPFPRPVRAVGDLLAGEVFPRLAAVCRGEDRFGSRAVNFIFVFRVDAQNRHAVTARVRDFNGPLHAVHFVGQNDAPRLPAVIRAVKFGPVPGRVVRVQNVRVGRRDAKRLEPGRKVWVGRGVDLQALIAREPGFSAVGRFENSARETLRRASVFALLRAGIQAGPQNLWVGRMRGDPFHDSVRKALGGFRPGFPAIRAPEDPEVRNRREKDLRGTRREGRAHNIPVEFRRHFPVFAAVVTFPDRAPERLPGACVPASARAAKREKVVFVVGVEKDFFDRCAVGVLGNLRETAALFDPGFPAVGAFVRAAHGPRPDRLRVRWVESRVADLDGVKPENRLPRFAAVVREADAQHVAADQNVIRVERRDFHGGHPPAAAGFLDGPPPVRV